MLEIRINDTSVDLPEDFTIEFKFLNPLLTENGFEESYSYSFSIPKSAKNKAFLERKKKVNVSISFAGFKIASGFGTVKTFATEFSIDFKTDSLNLSQLLAETNLRELELPTIAIADVMDDAPTKITKWINHMTQTTITDSPLVGSHKFPSINCFDRTLSSTSGDATEIRDRNIYGGSALNLYADGVYVSSPGVSGGTGWFNSASPCLRIQYLFEQLFEKLGIYIHSNELNDIIEFKQLIHFSGLSMELEEDFGGKNYNVFGTDIDLNLFAPNLNGIDLTNLLNELFGTFFTFKNGRIYIRLKKTILSTPAIDFSKYCEPLYENEQLDSQNIYLNYDIDIKDKWAQFDGKVWYKYISAPVLPGLFEPIDVNQITNHEALTIGAAETKEEKFVSYIPLISQTQQFSAKYPTLAIDDPIEFYFQLDCYFMLQNFTPISSKWNQAEFEKGGLEKFYLGLIRGNYSTFRSDTPIQDGFTPPDNYLTGTTVQRAFFSNLNKIDAVAGFEDFTEQFGTCSIYLNDGDSHVDKYLLPYYELIRSSDTITKNLNLPIHKIMEILSWENPNHIIEQRNLSFRGTVKELSFVLGNNRISQTTISYLVKKADESNSEFNNDYNNDFVN